MAHETAMFDIATREVAEPLSGNIYEVAEAYMRCGSSPDGKTREEFIKDVVLMVNLIDECTDDNIREYLSYVKEIEERWAWANNEEVPDWSPDDLGDGLDYDSEANEVVRMFRTIAARSKLVDIVHLESLAGAYFDMLINPCEEAEDRYISLYGHDSPLNAEPPATVCSGLARP